MTSLRANLRLILVLALIMASLLVVGIGVQSHEYQKDRDSHDACVDAWGNALIHTLHTRSSANKALRKATKRFNRVSKVKGDDGDDIFLVVAGLRAVPPTNTVRDFDKALQQFAVAKAAVEHAAHRLSAVNQHVNRTARQHRYRSLNCE